ncbi:hypothetical protein [Halalkalicoccus salilacus]|uniref:hypothetical protein n=1 Tax=Halalkalicoccus sp. GCM10025704 TaxID=3252662 RepID=UPI0036072B24
MASQRVAAFIGSGLLIVGAVLVGEVLHVTVVRGETPITDLSVLLRAALGLGLVLVGARLDAHPREYLSVPSDRAGEESGEEGVRRGALPARRRRVRLDRGEGTRSQGRARPAVRTRTF